MPLRRLSLYLDDSARHGPEPAGSEMMRKTHQWRDIDRPMTNNVHNQFPCSRCPSAHAPTNRMMRPTGYLTPEDVVVGQPLATGILHESSTCATTDEREERAMPFGTALPWFFGPGGALWDSS